MNVNPDLQQSIQKLLALSTMLHARIARDDVPDDLEALIKDYDFALRSVLAVVIGSSQLHDIQIDDLDKRVKKLEGKN